MNLEKIQILAKNLSSLLPKDIDTLYDVYIWGASIRKKYWEYFHKISVPDYLKLVISIWSYKKTGSFNLSKNIFNNLFFVYFFTTDLDAYVYECDECAGDGDLTCSVCDYGEIDCDECAGGGDIECEECGGSGKTGEDDEECEECGGGGYITCGECGGNGRTTCDNCNGSSKETCGECDGSGENESDDQILYTKRVYLSWNQELKDLSELRVNTTDGIDYIEFDRLIKKDTILIAEEEDHGVPSSDLDPNQYYIFDLDDDASNLSFGSSDFIKMNEDPDQYFD